MKTTRRWWETSNCEWLGHKQGSETSSRGSVGSTFESIYGANVRTEGRHTHINMYREMERQDRVTFHKGNSCTIQSLD